MEQEIPAYQAIDLVLGNDKGVTIPPVRGWAITHPVLGAEMFEREEEADARIAEIAASDVKWPDHTSKWKAWLHSQQSVMGKLSNRRFWTPR